MNKEFDELYHACVSSFGSDRVSRRDLHDPDAIEIEIALASNADNKLSKMQLSIYKSKPAQFFMFIDDFRFEYDDKEQYAISEMKKYIKAAAENKLGIRSWSILGLKFNQKLVIND